jgi:hypothetical protein
MSKVRSNLVQRHVWMASSANEVFAERGGVDQVLVIVPSTPTCPQPYFTVPAGPYVLWQSWGKNKGQLSPGLKLCWMPWNRVSHIVTKAAITYDAPAYNVPTADNVMVEVDVSITFSITGGDDAAADFVYKIGARNFNDYLSSKIEEAIRGLVYGVTHNKVNDLREEFAVTMLDNLKSKFMVFGVRMMNVKVTDVKLPTELQQRLEKTTAFQTKIEEAQVRSVLYIAVDYISSTILCVFDAISLLMSCIVFVLMFVIDRKLKKTRN